MAIVRGKLVAAGRLGKLRDGTIPVAGSYASASHWPEVARLDIGFDVEGRADYRAPLPHLGSVLGVASEALGTLSKTLPAITSASAGTVEVVGTLSASIGALGKTLAGGVEVAGQLGNAGSAPIGTVTVSALGGIGQVGSLNASIGTITSASAGTVDVAGALAKSIGTIGLAVVGGPEAAATLSKTLAAITLAASGEAGLAQAQGGDAAPLPHLGLVLYDAGAVVGQLTKSIGTVGITAAGLVPLDELPAYDFWDQPAAAPYYYPWAHDASWIQTDTVNRADVGGVVGATIVTFGAVTSVAAGAVDIGGTLANTFGAFTASGAGRVDVGGTTSKTIGSVTVLSAGDVTSNQVANLNAQIAPITLAVVGGPVAGADLARTLGPVTVSAFGDIGGGQIVGSVARSIGNVTLATVGGPAVVGGAAVSIGAVTSGGAGSVLSGFVASLIASLPPITSSATGQVIVYELGVRRRWSARQGEQRIGDRKARATEKKIEGALVE